MTRRAGMILGVTLLCATIAANSAPKPNPGPLAAAKAGLTALENRNYAAAIKSFTAALNAGKLDPKDRELALLKRAEAYSGAGKKDLAMADLKAAASLNPDDPDLAGLTAEVSATPQGPSMQETISYIRENAIAGNYTFQIPAQQKVPAYSLSRSYVNVAMRQPCILDVESKSSTQMDSGQTDAYFTHRSWRLSVLSSSSVVSHESPIVPFNVVAHYPDFPSATDGPIIFSFTDQDRANRVAKAVNHAIEICNFVPDPISEKTAQQPDPFR